MIDSKQTNCAATIKAGFYLATDRAHAALSGKHSVVLLQRDSKFLSEPDSAMRSLAILSVMPFGALLSAAWFAVRVGISLAVLVVTDQVKCAQWKNLFATKAALAGRVIEEGRRIALHGIASLSCARARRLASRVPTLFPSL